MEGFIIDKKQLHRTSTSDDFKTNAAIFLRSKRKIVLTGSETEEEARQAEKVPVILPEFPKFKDVHSQRVHMKQKLAAGFRLLAKFGWDEGSFSE